MSGSRRVPNLIAATERLVRQSALALGATPRSLGQRGDVLALAAVVTVILTLFATLPLLRPQPETRLASVVPRTVTETVAMPQPPVPTTAHRPATVPLPRSRPLEPLAPPDPVAQAQLASIVQELSRAMPAPRTTEAPSPDVAAADTAPIAPSADSDVGFAAPRISEPGPKPAVAFTPPAEVASEERVCHAPTGLGEASHTRRVAMNAAPDPALTADPALFGKALAAAAVAESASLVVYDATYVSIPYPRGDVAAQFGVCTDVVIRAYRALGIDLQQLVHLNRGIASDPNIDHRRTELLRAFLASHGQRLTVTPFAEDYLPGDIVTYYRPQNRSSTSHIAIVTDQIGTSGRPLIVHNRGWGVLVEDALFVDQITGHYRFRGLIPDPAQGGGNDAMTANLANRHGNGTTGPNLRPSATLASADGVDVRQTAAQKSGHVVTAAALLVHSPTHPLSRLALARLPRTSLEPVATDKPSRPIIGVARPGR